MSEVREKQKAFIRRSKILERSCGEKDDVPYFF
jgi:hypothetical protein